MCSLPQFEVEPLNIRKLLLAWLAVLAVVILACWVGLTLFLRSVFGLSIEQIPWDTGAWQRFEEPTDRLAMREGLDGVLIEGLPIYSVRGLLGFPDSERILEGDDNKRIVLEAAWRMGSHGDDDLHLFAEFHGLRGHEKLVSWRVDRY